MKKILKLLYNMWWRGFWRQAEQFRIEKCQRNDEEYENQRRFNDPVYLDRFGYKVYSQNDEDGIIAEIFKRIGTTNKKFVEFGVQNGLECNTHFLLHKEYEGIWIEGNKGACQEIKRLFAHPLDQGRLKVINAFITKDNINELIGGGGVIGEMDLLSIDIDGNDYWVWEAITCISPRLVVIEYNAKFPPDVEWIMKYDAHHIWEYDDEQGASLKSLELLGIRLGYQLVGTNLNGVNAFFVKKELAENLFPLPATAENLYHTWAHFYRKYFGGLPSKKYIGK